MFGRLDSGRGGPEDGVVPDEDDLCESGYVGGLIPGGAKRDLSTLQAKRLLASVRPRTLVGKTLRRMAAEEIADLVAVDAKLKVLKKELRTGVAARGSHLMGIYGIGPAGAARILADVADVVRFPDRNHFASWTGTAPLDASSGEHIHHRLSRAGNRRMNHVLHIAGIVQIRHDTEGRAYYRRKLAEGKTPMEALRCLKRRISDAVFRQLVADTCRAGGGSEETGPGGHSGASSQSSAADLHTPVIGSSDQPQPGPAPPTLPPPQPRQHPRTASTARPSRRRAGAVKVQRPTGRTTLTATSTDAPSKASRPRP
jgi:transposase